MEKTDYIVFFIIIIFIGISFIGLGLILQNGINLGNSKIEVLNNTSSKSADVKIGEVTIEISGNVETPGVYHLPTGARIEDALIVSGGITANADRNWVDKNLNRAAKLTDGQKLYIPGI